MGDSADVVQIEKLILFDQRLSHDPSSRVQPVKFAHSRKAEQMPVIDQVDPLWLASSQLRRRKFEKCVETCDSILRLNQRDQATVFVKCRAITEEVYIDDADLDEEGVGDLMLDDNAIAGLPRPGTSITRPNSSRAHPDNSSQSIRPTSTNGRPLSGFVRPGTTSRPNVQSSDMTLKTASKGNRPLTSLGREVRLATASLTLNDADSLDFLNADRLNMSRLALRPALAMCVAQYLLHFSNDAKRALELASEATKNTDFHDWWWKAFLATCYRKLGLFREAERQATSSLKEQSMISTTLILANIYLRLDTPNTALELLSTAINTHMFDSSLLLMKARIHDLVGDQLDANRIYRESLRLDASCVEAIACLAANHFYSDQPEIALRYYRRLLQMGILSVEIFNNLGLCCFASNHLDLAISCFSRALVLAQDAEMPDVWYNIGHVAIGLGDLPLANQAWKITLGLDSTHAEANCNLAILELRKQNMTGALSLLRTATSSGGDHLYEVHYNQALLAFKGGSFQESFSFVSEALRVFPGHPESLELHEALGKVLSS